MGNMTEKATTGTGTTAESTMRVEIDRERCCGYMVCSEISPRVYQIDEQGFAVTEYDEVPEELQDEALEGAECCPELAILIDGKKP